MVSELRWLRSSARFSRIQTDNYPLPRLPFARSSDFQRGFGAPLIAFYIAARRLRSGVLLQQGEACSRKCRLLQTLQVSGACRSAILGYCILATRGLSRESAKTLEVRKQPQSYDAKSAVPYNAVCLARQH